MFDDDRLVPSIARGFLDTACKIALGRIQSGHDRCDDSVFDETLLPYRDFINLEFSDLDIEEVKKTKGKLKSDLEEIFCKRQGIRKDVQYAWALKKDYKYHCACELLECHLEAEQCVHYFTGLIYNRLDLYDNISAWLVFKARDYAFYVGSNELLTFLKKNLPICDCRSRTRMGFWATISTLAMHSGNFPDLHELFIKRIKADIEKDATLTYYLAKFEDFRANHRLVNRGQILGSFLKLVDGKAVYCPPIEDLALADKLREKFGLQSVEAFRQESEKHLKAGTLPWDR